jgi:hypothetical protein
MMGKFIKFIQSLLSTLLQSKEPDTHSIQNDVDEKKERAFQFQLEMLTKEIDIIDKSISRYDEHGRATRNWAVVIWGGTVVTILSQLTEFRSFVGITTIIPLLFWLIDTRWSYLLRSNMYRMDKISEYLSSEALYKSFKASELIGFWILDPRARKHRGEAEFMKKVNYRRIMLQNKELAYFYGGLMFFSIALGVFFFFQP